MPLQADDSNQEPYFIFTREEADELVVEALDTDVDEPEPFVKLLLVLYDNARENRMKDALYELMKAAYDGSIVHSIDFQEYLRAIRLGQNPLEEARARRSDDQQPDA